MGLGPWAWDFPGFQGLNAKDFDDADHSRDGRLRSKRRDSRSRRRSPHGRDELKIRSRSRRHRQRASRSPREEDMRQKQRRMILKERQADEKALAEKFAEPRDGATLSCFLCGRQGFKGQFALSQHWWSKHEDHPEAALRAKSSAS